MPRQSLTGERSILGGHDATCWGEARNPGYHSRNIASQSPFNTRVRICSSRCAPCKGNGQIHVHAELGMSTILPATLCRAADMYFPSRGKRVHGPGQHVGRGFLLRAPSHGDQAMSSRRRRSSSVQRVACRTLRRVLRVKVLLPLW